MWPTFQVKVRKGWSQTSRFFFRLLEALELKCREKSSLRLSQVFFLSKATEVITNEQNHSTTLSSLNG